MELKISLKLIMAYWADMMKWSIELSWQYISVQQLTREQAIGVWIACNVERNTLGFSQALESTIHNLCLDKEIKIFVADKERLNDAMKLL